MLQDSGIPVPGLYAHSGFGPPLPGQHTNDMPAYAIIGVSHRAIRLCHEMPPEVSANWTLTGLWDIDPKRFEAFAAAFGEQGATRYLGPGEYCRMLDEQKPDLVIIGTRDCYHVDGIMACLERGIDAMVEKPMVIDSAQARRVLDAEAASKARLHVGFNYRYMASSIAIKELLDAGRIGRVTAVEIAIYLNEIHGSSFFQRWNRLRSNSGGLSIHKEGHYLDLLGWWLGQRPVEVFSYGALNYYGPDGELNPSRQDGRRCSTCEETELCAYYQVRARKEAVDSHITGLQGVHLEHRSENAGWYSDYSPDQCIFDSEIDIEDTYSAVMRYSGNTLVTFSVNFSSPIEQHRVVFNGTRGRLEHGYAFGEGGLYHDAPSPLVLFPLFSQEPERIPVNARSGGHGGGDPAMLEDIFSDAANNRCRATALDGAYAVAAGEAMWRSSVAGGRAIRIAELLPE